jgi:hypothetical protein
MPVWAVTGKLGAGKTLVAVSRIQKYLNANRRVATNLDLNLEHLINVNAKKTECFRLPDVPSVDSFINIGLGYDGDFIGDEKNGLVVLDECAKWLNSRDWNDKSRKKLIDYFVHLRKKRWDLILIIQDIDALDKQFRSLYCEHVVYCSRSDRYSIPFIGPILKLFLGERITLPRVHVGNVYYCVGNKENHVENWLYRGNAIMSAYNTEQGFNEETSPELYTFIPPYFTHGRYINRKEQFFKTLQSIKIPHFFFIGLLFGGFGIKAMESDGNSPDRGAFLCNDDWKQLFGDCEMSKTELLKIVADHKQGATVPARAGLSAEGQAVGDPAFDNSTIYISASVRQTDGFQYYFVKSNGVTWYPEDHDFKISWVDYCTAKAIGMNENLTIRCNSVDLSEREPYFD